MSIRIFKYTTDTLAPFEFEISQHCKFLHFGYQHDRFAMWFEVDPEVPTATILLQILPTGAEVPEGAAYMGTCLVDYGNYVWHLYVLRKP